MNYYIKINSSNKAKNDIDEIIENLGYKNLAPFCNHKNAIVRYFSKVFAVIHILFKVHKNDNLFLQYPLKKFYTTACIFSHWKNAKNITIIHDLGAFRRHKLTATQENKRLSYSDIIIVHNESMARWLIDHGCKRKLLCLGIFDYLSKTQASRYQTLDTPWKIIYAGGLGERKNAFLYHIDNYMSNWEMDLYGKGLDPHLTTNWNHIHYHGSLPSDELISSVKGHFGLVWDGDSMDECSGNWGEYLRFNNPHKTSCYIRAELPIIIWENAALASFIKENNIGITITSLQDLNHTFENLDLYKYNEMKKNVIAMSQKLAAGYFITSALQKANSYILN